MTTNSTQIKKTTKQYIIENIDNSNYSEKELLTDKDKVNFLHETFKSEYQWRVDQVGLISALIDYLQGLPSSVHIPYSNYDILESAKLWGSLPFEATEKQEDKLLSNYWNYMANMIAQLFSKYGVQ